MTEAISRSESSLFHLNISIQLTKKDDRIVIFGYVHLNDITLPTPSSPYEYQIPIRRTTNKHF